MSKKDVLKLLLKVLLSICSIVAIFGIILCLIVWFFQDKFLFFPRHDNNSYNELKNKDDFEEIIIENDDYKLHGWIKYNSDLEVSPLVIYYGGNAQNSSSTFNFYDDVNFFNYFENYNILYIDYPGYGLSLGTPSSKSFLEAGLLIYDYAYNLECVDKSNIVILGYSIGTGVATYVSSLRSINGLILLAPYDELLSMYNEKINIFYGPLRKLVKHNITSSLYAKDVNVSPLIIASKDDKVINYNYSLNLIKSFKHTENVIITSGFGHNDFFNQNIVLENINNYLDKKIII